MPFVNALRLTLVCSCRAAYNKTLTAFIGAWLLVLCMVCQLSSLHRCDVAAARITANETAPHDQRWSAGDAVAAPWGERRDGVACLEGVRKLGEREL